MCVAFTFCFLRNALRVGNRMNSDSEVRRSKENFSFDE